MLPQSMLTSSEYSWITGYYSMVEIISLYFSGQWIKQVYDIQPCLLYFKSCYFPGEGWGNDFIKSWSDCSLRGNFHASNTCLISVSLEYYFSFEGNFSYKYAITGNACIPRNAATIFQSFLIPLKCNGHVFHGSLWKSLIISYTDLTTYMLWNHNGAC